MTSQVGMVICEERKKLLDHKGHGLVLGGPGSGKTTLALLKAERVLTDEARPHQSVLFLSFSNAAINRLILASRATVVAEIIAALNIQTFHSFFWSLVKPHSYLLGLPKRVSILLPHDEKSLSNGVKEDDLLWGEWLQTRARLCRDEGRIAFDMFAQLAFELLSKSSHLRDCICNQYPLIVVDEAQDTAPIAWECIRLLAEQVPVICLADIEQQIFDHLPGIGPDRIAEIRKSLNPLEIDLACQNQRSPGTDITRFANDIRTCRSGGPYVGVGGLRYNWRTPYDCNTVRKAIGIVSGKVRSVTGQRPESLAVLLPYGSSAAKLSAAMNAWEKPVRHRFLCDEAETILAARFCAYLLEEKSLENIGSDLCACLELLSQVKRAKGSAEAAKYDNWSKKIAAGRPVRAKLVRACEEVLRNRCAQQLLGDPVKDWIMVKKLLRASDDQVLVSVANQLDLLIGFNRGKRIAADLSAAWQVAGEYINARGILETALARDQIVGGQDETVGIQVMTIHKSKGKQFDGVILLSEPTMGTSPPGTSFVWRDDKPPFPRSRRILSVGITRARFYTLILQPAWPSCAITSRYTLGL